MERTPFQPDKCRLLTTQATARVLGVSLNLLRMWRWRNTGPAYVRFPGPRTADMIRYREDVIQAYVAEHEVWTNRMTRLTHRYRRHPLDLTRPAIPSTSSRPPT